MEDNLVISKKCIRCSEVKDINSFAINKKCYTGGGRGNICYDCNNKYKKNYRKKKENDIVNNSCFYLYNSELELYDMTIEELKFVVTDKCHFTDIKFNYTSYNPNTSLAFDRIDRSKKYSINNIICVTSAIKKIRTNQSYEEMCKIFGKIL